MIATNRNGIQTVYIATLCSKDGTIR